ncbi:MAG: leucyl/phenylalanyl-tRNA--protein transferase [Bacteroidales bacterium]|nr:leucyl/phenylalanyl-tRNA--protein transferase [Bacteroidales bacterium]
MIFKLSDELIFPPVEYADSDGVLAIGGDLSVSRLLLAYASGIFPWFNEGDPILWWAPPLRPIFTPGHLKVSKSLRQIIRKGVYKVTFDRAFEEVLFHCASVPREGQFGTWLTADMKKAYTILFQLGYCHSVEAWHQDQLVGGLYGVSIGGFFVGESMFHLKDNASKVAFYYLSEWLHELGFHFIDGQVPTSHLMSLGAKEVARNDYMALLRKAIQYQPHTKNWRGKMFGLSQSK